jgi:hypothetical protein
LVAINREKKEKLVRLREAVDLQHSLIKKGRKGKYPGPLIESLRALLGRLRDCSDLEREDLGDLALRMIDTLCDS